MGSQTDLTFNIQNTGNAALNVTGLTLTGTDAGVYSLASPPTLPFQVATSGAQAITVRFAPLQVRPYNAAVLTMVSNDPTTPQVSVTLTGTGGQKPAQATLF